MVRNHRRGLCLLSVVILLSACSQVDDRLEQSRAIVDEFQRELGGELRMAMAAGGPVNAIGVCSERAPAIAAGASAASGAEVGRTALRVRNPDNAPDAEAAAVLREFQEKLSADAELPLEHVETQDDGGLRYMRAIVLEPLCASCHGTTLAPEVEEAVAERYPQDRATDFEVGDLRGAFLIDWPAQGNP